MTDAPDSQPNPAEPPDAPEDAPRFGKPQIIAGIITLVILVLVFAVVLPQLGDYGAAWDAIQDMESWQLGILVGATIVMIVFYVFPFQAALPGLKFREGFLVRQTSFMISNVIPAGGAFGLAVQYGMLQGYGFGAAPSTAAIGITSLWNTLTTLALPVIGLIALLLVGEGDPTAISLTVIATLAIVTLIVVLALVLRRESTARRVGGWVNGLIQWAAGLINKDVSFDASGALVSFRASIIGVVQERWILITLANLFQQLAQFSILYLAVVILQGGLDGPISLGEALAAFSFGRLATFIPVPPGGLGTTDAIITGVLTELGLANNDALAATLIWRAATFFPQVIIGFFAFLAHQRDRNKAAA